MAKVKVTVKFQILELINQFVDNATANAIGRTVVDEAKRMISEGQSPVRGYGRFQGYSESYKSWIKGERKKRGAEAARIVKTQKGNTKKVRAKAKAAKETAQKFGKQTRPVNLHLSGEMLEGYGYRVSGNYVEVGMTSGSADKKQLAQYHNDGTEIMPQRKLVPGEGEEWAVSIMRSIRDEYGKRLETLIRQSNKKS